MPCFIRAGQLSVNGVVEAAEDIKCAGCWNRAHLDRLLKLSSTEVIIWGCRLILGDLDLNLDSSGHTRSFTCRSRIAGTY